MMSIDIGLLIFGIGVLWFAPLILTGLCYMIGAFFGIMKQGYEDRRKP